MFRMFEHDFASTRRLFPVGVSKRRSTLKPLPLFSTLLRRYPKAMCRFIVATAAIAWRPRNLSLVVGSKGAGSNARHSILRDNIEGESENGSTCTVRGATLVSTDSLGFSPAPRVYLRSLPPQRRLLEQQEMSLGFVRHLQRDGNPIGFPFA